MGLKANVPDQFPGSSKTTSSSEALLKELNNSRDESDVLSAVHAVFVASLSLYILPPGYISILKQM